MSFLYDRLAKLVIGTSSTELLVFDERFRISFSISKTSTSTPAIANMSIYNLSDNDRKKLESIPKKNIERQRSAPPLICLFYAGYKDANGYELLYSGDIISVDTAYKPPNYVTKLMCGAAISAINNRVLNISYAAGINTNQIVEQIATILQMSVSKASNYLQTNVSFAKGYSFSGRAKDALDEISKECNFKWHVEKGQLVLTELNKSTNEAIIELDAKSGLIGVPTKSANQQAADTFDDGSYDGWNVRSLLQPAITPNRLIKVTSKLITNTLLVDSVTHKGDTRGKEWVSDVDTRAPGFGGL